MKKRILALLLVLALGVGLLPMGALAENEPSADEAVTEEVVLDQEPKVAPEQKPVLSADLSGVQVLGDEHGSTQSKVYKVKLRGPLVVKALLLIDKDGEETWATVSTIGKEISLSKAGLYQYKGYSVAKGNDEIDEGTCIGSGYFNVNEADKAPTIQFQRYIYNVRMDPQLGTGDDLSGRLEVNCTNRNGITFEPGIKNPNITTADDGILHRDYLLLIANGGTSDPTEITIQYLPTDTTLATHKDAQSVGGFTQTTLTAWVFAIVEVTVRVPSQYADLFHLYEKPENHYVPFIEYEYISKTQQDDGYTNFRYELTPKEGFHFHYTIDHDETLNNIKMSRAFGLYSRNATDPVITIRGYSKNVADYNMNYWATGNFTEYTLDNGYRMGRKDHIEDNLYLNVDDSNYITLGIGDTQKLEAFRVWQAVNNVVSNYFIEPDFHYTVIGDSVSIEQKGAEGREYVTVKAEKEGISVILVTYDSMYWAFGAGGSGTLATQSLREGGGDNLCYYDAILPINTRAVVVNVGGKNDAHISANLAVYDEEKHQGGGTEAETVYFDKAKANHADYTFTPTADDGHTLSVRVHDPIYSETWWSDSNWATEAVWNDASKWHSFAIREDGSCTIELKDGRNIVEISAEDGSVVYYVINCRGIGIEIKNLTRENAKDYKTGDTIQISFDGLSLPIQKMAGIYNPNFPNGGWVEYKNDAGETVKSRGLQYAAVAKSACMITVKLTQPGDLLLTNGSIHTTALGDGLGGHRNISEDGRAVNTNASASNTRDYFSTLPDILIAGITGEPIEDESGGSEPQAPVAPAFTVKLGNGNAIAKKNITLTKNGYEYTGYVENQSGEWVDVPLTLDLYTVKVPTGTATVDLLFSSDCLAYGYDDDKETCTEGEDEYSGGVIGKRNVSRSVDKDGDGKIDFVLVQSPYVNGESTTFYAITFAYQSEETGGNTGGTPTTPQIHVTFRLIGSTKSSGAIDLYDKDYKGAEYVTWVKTTPYTFDATGSVTVGDLFKKAMDDAGLSYIGLSKNYISSITAPSACGGYALAEMDNGYRSGWMYTVNDVHPDKGLNYWYLSDGDEVVWHYVNDYLYEVPDWSEGNSLGDRSTWSKWLEAADTNPTKPSSGTPSTGNTDKKDDEAVTPTEGTTVEVAPEATVSNGEAKAEVSSSQISSALTEAKKDENTTAIVIAPEVKGDADKVTVELPKTAVSNVANNSDLAVTVSSDVADITIQNEGLTELAKETGSTVTVSAEKTEDGAVKVEVAVGDKVIDEVAGGLNIAVPVNEKDAGNVMVIVDAEGNETVIKKSAVDEETAKAIVDGSCTVKIVDNSKDFTDVKDGAWYAGDVDFASSHELSQGVSATQFAPETSMTRAMLATVLFRLEDAAATGANAFADVPAGTWYTDAVTWANGAGIVQGYGNSFGSEDNITRQDLATMLFRYAKTVGMDTAVRGDMGSFNDTGKVSDYADDAMRWAVGMGIIGGKGNGVLDPKGNATRAEVAAMLQRMVKIMVK